MSFDLAALLAHPERDAREMYAKFFRHQGWREIAVSVVHDALPVGPRAIVTRNR